MWAVTWGLWAFVGRWQGGNQGSWGETWHGRWEREEPGRRGTPGENCVEKMPCSLQLSRRWKLCLSGCAGIVWMVCLERKFVSSLEAESKFHIQKKTSNLMHCNPHLIVLFQCARLDLRVNTYCTYRCGRIQGWWDSVMMMTAAWRTPSGSWSVGTLMLLPPADQATYSVRKKMKWLNKLSSLSFWRRLKWKSSILVTRVGHSVLWQSSNPKQY